MKIRLIWPGKTKEQFILEGISKYLKLSRPYADISIIEIKGRKRQGCPENGRKRRRKDIETSGALHTS